MPIKNNLKMIRHTQYQMNLTESSAYLGLALSTYSQIESGKRKVSIPRALEISEKLNLTVNEIWFNVE